MINEKLDFALADQLGWVNAWDGIRLVWLDGKTNEFRCKVTDWHPSTDPAASLEVEKIAIEHDFDAYVQNLASVKWGEPDDDVEDTTVWNKTMRKSIADLLTASPRERAEAAYMTLKSYQVDKQ
jgi:hypothetical protein